MNDTWLEPGWSLECEKVVRFSISPEISKIHPFKGGPLPKITFFDHTRWKGTYLENQKKFGESKNTYVTTNELPTRWCKIQIAYLKGGRVILYQSADFADFGFFYEN